MILEEKKWSGRKDLNLRPPGPEPGALARLRYAPTSNRATTSLRWNLAPRNTTSRQLSQLPGHDRCAAGAQRGRLVFNAKENAAKEPPVAALDVA
jgi:hypothetical protein